MGAVCRCGVTGTRGCTYTEEGNWSDSAALASWVCGTVNVVRVRGARAAAKWGRAGAWGRRGDGPASAWQRHWKASSSPPYCHSAPTPRRSNTSFAVVFSLPQTLSPPPLPLAPGDPASLATWERICAASRREFEAIYSRLGVTLTERGESFYNPMLQVRPGGGAGGVSGQNGAGWGRRGVACGTQGVAGQAVPMAWECRYWRSAGAQPCCG